MGPLTPQRRNRLLLWLTLAVLVAVVLWISRQVLLPYVVSLVLAYLLLPLVNWLDDHMPARFQQWRIDRPLAIIVTYVLLLAIIAGLLAFAVPLLVDQVDYLIQNWPTLAARAQDWGEQGWTWYQTLPDTWRTTIETNLKGLLGDIVSAIQDGVVAAIRQVFSTVGFIIGFIVIPFWMFYILHDASQVKKGVIGAFPERVRSDILAVASLVDDVLSAYIRGQFLLMLFVGGLATVVLLILGVPYALVLGLIAGIFEALPVVGPLLGAIPAVLVALLANPISAIYVAIAFFAIQQIENLFLVPRISGKSVKLHPALVMVVLVLGNQLAGFAGMLLAVPVTAIIRDLFKYLHLRLQDEPLSPARAAARVRARKQVKLDL
ncbi:MAG: AI-2E family transporter [Anaerolineae bacterium]|nr:AI-2E family transporter [Anaerolineae bacterium]